MSKYVLNTQYIAGTLKTLEQSLLRDDAFRLEWEERQMAKELAAMTRQMREEAGLSQGELAQKVGMSQPVIARLESRNPRRLPTFDTVARVAAACGRRMVVHFQRNARHDDKRPLIAGE